MHTVKLNVNDNIYSEFQYFLDNNKNNLEVIEDSINTKSNKIHFDNDYILECYGLLSDIL